MRGAIFAPSHSIAGALAGGIVAIGAAPAAGGWCLISETPDQRE
jgi:hypothetical protein